MTWIWIAAAAAGAIAILFVAATFSKAEEMTGEEVSDQITRFIEGRSKHPHEWDDFISVPIADSVLDDIREQCSFTHERFPPPDGRGWCNEDGVAALRELARNALSHAEAQRNGSAV